MNKIKYITLVVILAVGCRKHTPSVEHITQIVVINDQTDRLILRPEAEPIVSLFGFNDDLEQGATLRLLSLTDKKLNNLEVLNLPDAATSSKESRTDDIRSREAMITGFLNTSRREIKSFSETACDSGLRQSECYATIANQLEYLAGSHAVRRVLLIYSNLFENQDAFSIYKPDDFRLLKEHPSAVVKLLQQRHPLPNNLSGVTVYFVFSPISREDDIRFDIMVNLYKGLLKSRGARVVITTDNKTFEE